METSTDQSYLRFSKKERNGIMAILFILLFFLLLPYLCLFIDQQENLASTGKKTPVDVLEDSIMSVKDESDSNHFASSNETYRSGINEKNAAPVKLFYFDPNTIGIEGWVALGLTEKTARTIDHYRAKGGRFRKPEDIEKIWGMKPAMAERLKPYVQIREAQEPMMAKAQKKEWNQQRPAWQPKKIDINLADSAAWESLPGIGPSLARRIVNFRERLGGFYAISQVGETFGLPDSVFRKITAYLTYTSVPLKQVPLNTAGLEELKMHPYIRYRLANALEAYRKQHGPYRSVADIRQVMLVTDSIYQKLQPYLSVS